eukprot:3944024-Amphidinium_carterae.1
MHSRALRRHCLHLPQHVRVVFLRCTVCHSLSRIAIKDAEDTMQRSNMSGSTLEFNSSGSQAQSAEDI